jgi:Zn-dependent protease with chaperone function
VLVASATMHVRQVQRASIRGTAVQLSRIQFLDLYASVDDFAATMRVKPTPAVYLSNGNGTLNAFAAQSGWTNNYVVLSNELFANLRNDNREETRFILGHEIGHIRLHHYVRGRPYGRLPRPVPAISLPDTSRSSIIHRLFTNCPAVRSQSRG